MEREGWNCSLNKNAKNGTECEDHSSTQKGTELDRMIKKEQERNNLAEGPLSRMEQFQKSRNGPSPTSV